MKKLLFVIITALVGYAVWRRCTEDDIEREPLGRSDRHLRVIGWVRTRR